MPYKSKRQQRWAHTEAGKRALGEKGVKEFDAATKGHFDELPETAPKRGKRPQRRKHGAR